MNSVANGKIKENTPFNNIYIPPAAADNGTSFGGAFFVQHQIYKQPRKFILKHAYWGSEFTDQQYLNTIKQYNLPSQKLDKETLLKTVVEFLCNGQIVGWFQGRMELGARALGNRSLLADPRRADMRDIINTKIKFREPFRPFAPSILEEEVQNYFEITDSVPFMEKVYQIRPPKYQEIPAVTHVDGTGRLQTVSRQTNSLYWDLINIFYMQTGVPLLLNTSLNENEPIVQTPEEAIQCFLRTKMDVLVLGSYVIDRNNLPS